MTVPTVPPIAEETLLCRIAAARDLLDRLDIDALVLYAAPRKLGGGTQTNGNVAWCTGWTPFGAPSLLILVRGAKPVVVTGGPNEARVFATRVGNFAEVRRGRLAETVRAVLVDVGRNAKPRVGTAGSADMPAGLNHALAEFCDPVPVDKLIHDFRLKRGPDEIAWHRRAAGVSDRMVQRAMDLALVPGITPAEIMTEVEFTGRRMGADQAYLWLATGPAPPVTCFELFELEPEIHPGDRIQLGTVIACEGHYAQGLRMGVLGEPSPELAACARMLEEIQDAALAALKPGRPVHDLVDTLEALIDEHCPYRRGNDPFRFQSCHGLGLDYSEPALSGALSPDRDRSDDDAGPLVAENMVFEIHPNFTLPGLGHVCVGDTAVVTPHGGEWLTRYPRGLTILG